MSPNAGVESVLFDLYGTTIDIELDEDSPRLWTGLAAALDARGAPISAHDLRERFQSLLREEAEHGREGFLMEPVFRRLLTSLDAGDDVGRAGKLFRELSVKTVRLRPYVDPLFERLRRSGVKLGIVSNTEALLTRFELDRYPILQTAQTIVLSSQVGIQKPDPEIFRIALNRLGGAAATSVFIGNDWNADVRGARHAGLRVIYINDQAADDIRLVTGMHGIIESAPTLEAISSALRMWGWRHEDA